ncbi:MAG: trigger factor [Coriobacteriia bacterium]|nr:trigger factor [Coriobacteriia bacterium]
MKTTVKDLGDNKLEVKVSFTKEEVDKAITSKYKEIASKYKIPGFRKGKAPRPVIDNYMGKGSVLVQATDDLVNDSYPLSIDDADIFPVGKGDFGKGDAKILEDHKAYEYKYKIEVEPEFELSNSDPVKIKVPPEGATDAEIDAQIEQFREHYFTLENVKATEAAKADSTLSLNIEAKDDSGEKIETLTNENLNYHLGSKFLPEEFEKKLVGKKTGEKLTFKIKVPKEPTVYTTQLIDKTKNIDFKVEIKAIQKKVLPKVDDEWVKKNMGFDTVKELRKQIADQIVKEKEQQLPVLKENRALNELAKRIKGDIPEAAAEKKEAELMQDFFTQLQQSGMTFDQYLAQYGLTADKFKSDLKKQAKDVCKQDYALDAYAKAKNIKVSQADIEKEFKLGDPKNWQKLYNDWKRRGELHTVRRAISRMKAAKDLVKNAKVEEEKGKK